MHNAVMEFVRTVRKRFPDHFSGARVLELGSYDMNGTPRGEFGGDCDYTGIDWRAGPGVDVVCRAHEFRDPDSFDTIISTEMLEHDLHAEKSLRNAWELLRAGGLMLFTAATGNRSKHELMVGEEGHYGNVQEEEIRGLIEDLDGVDDFSIVVHGGDIRFWIKKMT